MRAIRAGASLVLGTLILACGEVAVDEPIDRDLATIQQRDTLVALTTYNSTSYFVYRGEPMGFEYDLLREFAEENDLELRVRVVRDRSELMPLLRDGEGDVVAARVVPDEVETERIAFTRPLYETRPSVVQRTGPPAAAELPGMADTILENPPGPDRLPSGEAGPRPARVELRVRPVRRPSQLAEDTVHLPRSSDYHDRLVELSDSLSGDIHVVEVEDAISVEPLIRRVARGQIRLTVSPENIGELTEEYYTNVVAAPVVGEEHPVTWAVRDNAIRLHGALDAWLAQKREEGLIEELYETYFVDREGYRERVASEYLTSETGRLSEYDPLFKQYAPEIGWDWMLLASQAYQESRFDEDARSWAGAQGLLQLMPATAREVDVSDPWDPEENVQGAVRYLDWLEEQWVDEISDPDQRLRFVLASYNAGAGHVGDARRLAEKNGDDPNDWESVAYWLLQLSKRKYYTDPVVKYGYCRGLEPVTYVSLILERFDHYRQFVDDGRTAEV